MKKTKNQEIRDISEALLKRFFASWAFNPLPDDYGLDFFISIAQDEVVLEYNFLVQLKGSDSLDYKDGFFNFVMKTKHLQSYIKNPIPILLVIYDVNTESGYWINIQKYCRNILNVQDPNWIAQKTSTTPFTHIIYLFNPPFPIFFPFLSPPNFLVWIFPFI